MNPDDVVIPVLDKRHKRLAIPEFPNDNEYPMEENQRNISDEYLKAEDIELNKLSFARMLVPYLSLGVVKGIFSKNWNFREQALNAIRLNLTPEHSSSM